MNMRFIIIFIITLCYITSLHADQANHFTNRPEVKKFINTMVKKHHFNENELIKLFSSVKERPTVMKKVKSPLEQRPWHTYQTLFVSEWRIIKGIEFWNKHKKVLDYAEKKYGIPASIIVATIGIETKYGLHTGEYPVIDALTNIGFSNSPRAPFFRSELEEFLLLTREQHLNPLKVMGSYAGAIGQPQFMPSSYRRYAISYAGHSKIDLSHNIDDIITSIANYYQQKGWKRNGPVASPASLVNNKFQIYVDKNQYIKITARPILGKYSLADNRISQQNKPYKIIELQNVWGNEYWYTFYNFDVIKRYNASDLYAMAVFQLSGYIENLQGQLS